MTNPLSTTFWGAPPTAPGSLAAWLVHRRVTLSIVLIAAIGTLDVVVVGARPLNILHVADPWLLASVIAVALGLFVRTWAAGTIHKWQQLAMVGPYAWVRHPLYVGSFLIMLGCCGLMQAPLSLLLILGPMAWIYWLAVTKEEAVLSRSYRDWPTYAQRVPRFLPRRIIRPSFDQWSLGQWLRNREYCVWLGAAAGAAALAGWQWMR